MPFKNICTPLHLNIHRLYLAPRDLQLHCRNMVCSLLPEVRHPSSMAKQSQGGPYEQSPQQFPRPILHFLSPLFLPESHIDRPCVPAGTTEGVVLLSALLCGATTQEKASLIHHCIVLNFQTHTGNGWLSPPFASVCSDP